MHNCCIISFVGIAVIIGLSIVLLVRTNKEKFCGSRKLSSAESPILLQLTRNADLPIKGSAFMGSDNIQYLMYSKGAENVPSWISSLANGDILILSTIKPQKDYVEASIFPQNSEPHISFVENNFIFSARDKSTTLENIVKIMANQPVYLYKK